MEITRKLSAAGNGIVPANELIGGKDDIWMDDISLSVLRRGDGITPGGHVIGSGGSTDVSNLASKVDLALDIATLTTTFQAADSAVAAVHAVELAQNTATLQGNIDANTAAIALVTSRATLTLDINTLSSDSANPTLFDPMYYTVLITHVSLVNRYWTIPDGTVDGQTFTMNKFGVGGQGAIGVGFKTHNPDGVLEIAGGTNVGQPGTYTWNGNMWFQTSNIAMYT